MALIKCKECGKEISDRAEACVKCGSPIAVNNSKTIKKQEKYTGVKVISFLFPLIGFIIYGVNIGTNKTCAKAGLKGALFGIFFIPVLCILFMLTVSSFVTKKANSEIEKKNCCYQYASSYNLSQYISFNNGKCKISNGYEIETIPEEYYFNSKTSTCLNR